ncbi:hypothetical protein AMTRI_Chr01g112380 [Amborella trichopoda]
MQHQYSTGSIGSRPLISSGSTTVNCSWHAYSNVASIDDGAPKETSSFFFFGGGRVVARPFLMKRSRVSDQDLDLDGFRLPSSEPRSLNSGYSTRSGRYLR